MSFFSFSPGGEGQPPKWTVSEDLWIYWAVAVPLTGVTVLSWFAWHQFFPVKAIGT